MTDGGRVYVFKVRVDMHLDVRVWWKWGTQKTATPCGSVRGVYWQVVQWKNVGSITFFSYKDFGCVTKIRALGELALALAALSQQLVDYRRERLDLVAQLDDVAVAGHLAALGVRAIGLGMQQQIVQSRQLGSVDSAIGVQLLQSPAQL